MNTLIHTARGRLFPVFLLAVWLSGAAGCEPDSAEIPDTTVQFDAAGDVSDGDPDGQSIPDTGPADVAQPGPDLGDNPLPPLPPIACPDMRFIGQVDPGDDCPSLEAQQPWDVRRLFADPENQDEILPESLETFCLYEWQGDSPVPGPDGTAALPGYKGQGPFNWMNRDCMVTATQSGAGLSETTLATVFLEHLKAFHKQAERPATLPWPEHEVRVAIVDSWPREDLIPGIKPGQSMHGLAMGRIVDMLVCDPMGAGAGTPCPITLRRHLALNLEEDGVPNNVDGGYYGFQGRLASAIYASVRLWKTEQPSARLIINLSLGWAPDYDEGSPMDKPGLSEAVKAVRMAIEHARCEGALVIAAAGNVTTGPAASSGPLLPAAWAKDAAPACAPDGPLVYAVSGVDGRDIPLRNARPATRAQFEAPAFAAVAELGDATGALYRTSPLTGSSVATAVTTAAAAAVWVYDSALTSSQVMQTVYDTAEDLGSPADICPGSGPCATSRRVSICRAAAAVSPGLTCTVIPAGSGSNVSWSAANATDIDTAGSFDFDGVALTQSVTPSGCSDPVLIDADAPGYPGVFGCPEDQLPNHTLVPFVDPQPGTDPCRACALSVAFSATSDLVYIAVDGDMSGTVYPEQLILTSTSGTTQQRWNLASATDTSGYRLGDGLTPGDTYRVELSASGISSGSVGWATLYWLNDRTSASTVRSSELSVR
ncbi:MAG: hypothetical protein ACI9WU_003257 [Myxococcota bacterium]|jgi:hypothetical protein